MSLAIRFATALLFLAGCAKAPSKVSSTSTGLTSGSSTQPTITTSTAAAADGCVTKSTAYIAPMEMRFTAEECSPNDVRLRQHLSDGKVGDFKVVLKQSILPYVVATTTEDGDSGLPINVFVVSAVNNHLLQMEYGVQPGASQATWAGPADISTAITYTFSSLSFAAMVINSSREGTFWNGTYSPPAYVPGYNTGIYIEGATFGGQAITVEFINNSWIWAPGYAW